ncbi:MAG: sulfur transferase domain-containing protein [Alphaproteobacteria bacterium]
MKTGINPRNVVTGWAQGLPAPWRRSLGPFGDWADMMFVDHGLIRLAYLNLHKITPTMWRSAQPGPGAIRQLATRGIKSILNLRGERNCGSYILEKRACHEHGIALFDMPINSRTAPDAQRVLRLKEIFDTMAYPALMHCKSGADRAGLAATLFLHLHEGRPVAEARRQLSWRYGHVKQARTGVIDYFFDEYERDREKSGRALFDWVQSPDYDAYALTDHFRSNVLANALVDFILRRE